MFSKMLPVTCNIDKNDRINRSVFGVIFILAALIGLGRGFLLLCGLILLVEGVIGWCGIPYLMSRFNKS